MRHIMLLLLLLALGGYVGDQTAAQPLPGMGLLPTTGAAAGYPPGYPRTAAMPAAAGYPAGAYAAGAAMPSATYPAAAALAPSQQATPAVRRPALAPGQCAVGFNPGQQCGGNLTSTYYNCSIFDSCENTAWAGGCCAAGAACTSLTNAGGWCWTCGGKLPKTLAAAVESAATRQPLMCTDMGAGGDYDYGCVLGQAVRFYEAQRSGRLPADNKVPWRGNTGLNDVAPNGASIAGGWYDAGDMTRFTFPMAWTVSTLCLAFLEFPDSFSGGAAESLLGSLKWAADWLLAARYAPDAFVAATWAPGASIKDSHDWWGKPEEVRQAANVRAVRAPQAGADLLAQGAAALAAVSVVYQGRNPAYSAELLDTARSLYSQALESRGFYSDTVPEVKGFYQSYSYIDDLAWGAAWLALRTREPEDLQNAQFYYQQHIEMEGGGDKRRFDYNNMLQGTAYLLAKLDPPRKDQWSRPIRDSMTIWLRGQQNITYTPSGMAFMDSWGNFRYVATQGFMGLLHNKLYPDLSRRVAVYSCFARKQARIMLGETGRSFVVGVGTNPPCRPHHRAASCGPSVQGLPCDCTALYNEGCNPNTLYGALVGGPNKEDKFEDVRTDFAAAEVTLDWNAGLTGLMAGLAGNKVSWDNCKASGLQEGRGDVPSTLTSAGGARRVPAAAWQQLLAAGGALLAAAALRR